MQQLPLDRRHVHVMLNKFGHPLDKELINYKKLWVFLGVDPPASHVDPESRFDPLPQPFRAINETVYDIIDRAWGRIAMESAAPNFAVWRRRIPKLTMSGESPLPEGSFLSYSVLGTHGVAVEEDGKVPPVGQPLLNPLLIITTTVLLYCYDLFILLCFYVWLAQASFECFQCSLDARCRTTASALFPPMPPSLPQLLRALQAKGHGAALLQQALMQQAAALNFK